MKSQRITKVITLHPVGNIIIIMIIIIIIWTKFHASSSNSWWDISLKTTNVSLMVELEEKSGEHQGQ